MKNIQVLYLLSSLLAITCSVGDGAEAPGMQLYVKKPDGSLRAVDARPDDTVGNGLRGGGVSQSNQMYYQGKPLPKGTSLADAGVGNEAVSEEKSSAFMVYVVVGKSKKLVLVQSMTKVQSMLNMARPGGISGRVWHQVQTQAGTIETEITNKKATLQSLGITSPTRFIIKD